MGTELNVAVPYNVYWADFRDLDISHFLILAEAQKSTFWIFSKPTGLASKMFAHPIGSFAPLLSPQSSIWGKNPILGPYIFNIFIIYRIPIYPLKGMPYFSFSHF